MATPPKELTLRPPKAPNLLIAPVEYDQKYQDQLLNALRLYFNQIDNFAQPFGTSTAGAYVTSPYGAFHYDNTTALTSGITNASTTPIPVTSTAGYPSSGAILIGTEIITYTAITSTTFAGTITRGAYSTSTSAHLTGDAVSSVQGTAATTITPMYLNATDFSNGVVLSYAAGASITSTITFQYSGVYNIQFSTQFTNSTTSDDNVTIWTRQNGADVVQTAGIVTVPSKHGGVAGALIAGWNIFISANKNDYVEFYWTTDSGNSVIQTYPAGTSPAHPVSPGVILTVSFVSAPASGNINA